MLPLESATGPCGPESSIFSAYSWNTPVLGSTRPSLFCNCSVNHSAPSVPTAGSCGCAPFVGTSHSRIVTFSSPTSAPGAAPRDASAIPSPKPRIAIPKIVFFLLLISTSRPNPLGREVLMRSRKKTILGIAILGLGLGIALASRGAAPGADVGELKVTIREWDVPTKGAHPHDPAVGTDGALWFTEQLQNKLGRVDPKTGVFQEYALKIEDSGPHGLVADSSGNIWFTGNAKGYIGKLDPRTGAVAAYKMPDAKADDPHTAVFDSHGIMWFTVQVGNFVGRLDPRTGKIDLKT